MWSDPLDLLSADEPEGNEKLPSLNEISKEIEEIEQELLEQEARRKALLRKLRLKNLPAFRKKALDPTKKYRVFTLLIKKTKHHNVCKVETICESSEEAIEHVEQLFGRSVEELFEVKPLCVSKPMSLVEVYHKIEEDMQ